MCSEQIELFLKTLETNWILKNTQDKITFVKKKLVIKPSIFRIFNNLEILFISYFYFTRKLNNLKFVFI